MSSSRNRSHGENGHSDYDEYRNIAPASVSDSELREIIVKHNNNKDLIANELQRLWDENTNQSSGWELTSKAKKVDTPSKFNNSGRGSSSAGRGGRGRGGNPSTGGRGSSGGRDSSRAPKATTPAPAVATSSGGWGSSNSGWGTVEATPSSNENEPSSSQAQPTKPIIQPVSKSVWASGSFVEKMKQKEAAKDLPPVVPENEVKPDDSEAKPTENSGESGNITTKPPKQSGRKNRTRGPKKDSLQNSEVNLTEVVDPTAVATSQEFPLSDIQELENNLISAQIVDSVVDSVDDAPSITVVNSTPIEPEKIIVATTAPVSVVENLAPVSTETVAAPTKGVVKLPGKWGVSEETTSSFQFGSFGGFSDAIEEVPQPTAVKSTTAAPVWGEENLNNVYESSNTAWSNSASSAPAIEESPAVNVAVPVTNSSSIFSQTKNISLEPTNINSNSAATRAPPGLEQNSNAISNNKQSTNTSNLSTNNRPTTQLGQNTGMRYKAESNTPTATAQSQNNQQSSLAPSILYSQQQQPQQNYNNQSVPPGISAANSNRSNNNAGLQPSLSNIPYAFSPFDVSVPPFSHPYASNTAATNVAPLPVVNNQTVNGQPQTSSVPLTAQSNVPPATVTPNALPGAAANTGSLQPQQYPSGPPYTHPYYGNPFYNQAYYYGQPHQVPNYYQQNRGLYQQRPYGADPYGNGGSIYPDVYQQGGQFPDASGTAPYGNMGIMPGNTTNTVQNPTGNSNAKSSKGGPTTNSTVSSTNQMNDHNASHLNNYPYLNPYNTRQLDAQQVAAWQFQHQNPAAGGWGAPMMPFQGSAAPTGSTGMTNQGFGQPQHLGMNGLPQQGQPGQPQQGSQGQQQSQNNSGTNPNNNQRSSGPPSYNNPSAFGSGARGTF
eukprot:gene4033-5770_t